MKIKLRNILTLSLALLSTVSFAQFDLENRTRVNMHGDNSMNLTESRTTVATTVGGDDWGVHLSSDVNFVHNDGSNGMLTLGVYEAYAKANLFGFADMTIGRQAWDFGSGYLIGSNQWGAVRNTNDGMLFDIANDMVDLSIGYTVYNEGNVDEEDMTGTLLNASKGFGDLTANLLVIMSNDGMGTETTASGLDLGYSAMGGALDLSVGMNRISQGDLEGEMTMIGATYNVSDDLSVSASQTTYNEVSWIVGGTNYGYGQNSWLTHGNLGTLNPNDELLSIGVDYNMGGIDLSYSMHTITNSEGNLTQGTGAEEATASELTVGYSLNDNAALSLKYATSDLYNLDGDDFMWLSLSVTP